MDDMVVPDILDVLYNLGDYAIFLWLYITERKAHQKTVEEFEEYLMNNRDT